MKVEYINPFIASTIETFTSMLMTEVKPGAPAIAKEPDKTYDISGIIGLSGEAVGSIAISFPRKNAFKIVSKFVGMELTEVGPDVIDAVGELVNIVSGNAKKHFTGLNLTISLPNVVIGDDHVIAPPRDADTIIVPFFCELGDFIIEVNLKD